MYYRIIELLVYVFYPNLLTIKYNQSRDHEGSQEICFIGKDLGFNLLREHVRQNTTPLGNF